MACHVSMTVQEQKQITTQSTASFIENDFLLKNNGV